MKDCPSIQPQVDKTGFSGGAFVKVAKNYHEQMCKNDDCIVFVKKKTKLDLSIAPVFSYSFSKSFLNEGNNPCLIYPVNVVNYGVALNFSDFAHITPNLSIQLQLSHSKTDYTIDASNYYAPWDKNQLFTLSITRIPLLVKYRFPINYVRPFISTGLVYNIRKESNVNPFAMDLIHRAYVVSVTEEGYNWVVTDLATTQISAEAMVGVAFEFTKRLCLETGLGYEKGFSFILDDITKDPSHTRNINFQLAFFWKFIRSEK
jgi:hypothetical protein